MEAGRDRARTPRRVLSAGAVAEVARTCRGPRATTRPQFALVVALGGDKTMYIPFETKNCEIGGEHTSRARTRARPRTSRKRPSVAELDRAREEPRATTRAPFALVVARGSQERRGHTPPSPSYASPT